MLGREATVLAGAKSQLASARRRFVFALQARSPQGPCTFSEARIPCESWRQELPPTPEPCVLQLHNAAGPVPTPASCLRPVDQRVSAPLQQRPVSPRRGGPFRIRSTDAVVLIRPLLLQAHRAGRCFCR